MPATTANHDGLTRVTTSAAHDMTAVLALPFDMALEHYAKAVRAGRVKNSLLASTRFSRALSAMEKMTLGPWARGR